MADPSPPAGPLDRAARPTPRHPHDVPPATDFAAAYAREQAERERGEAAARAAYRARVADPARQLRPEWDAAWVHLSD